MTIKKHNTNKTLTAVITSLLMTIASSYAALLSIDLGSTSNVEPGFSGMTNAGGIENGVTVSFSSYGGPFGPFDRDVNIGGDSYSGTGTNPDFFRDFIFTNNSGGWDLELSGLTANTPYYFTFWAFDSAQHRATAVQQVQRVTSGVKSGGDILVGTKLEGFGSAAEAALITDFSLTATYTSDASGNITFFMDGSGSSGGASGRNTINGFEINAVPEPSSTALIGLGGLALILRRRK